MREPNDHRVAAGGWSNWAGDQRCASAQLLGAAANELEIGDRVHMRHAKASELCERFAGVHLLAGDRIVEEVPTYRGEGRCFL